MKIVIFGSTGTIGRKLLEQALKQGHMVTAFARKPEKIELKSLNLKIIQGDVLNKADVEKAVDGQDAILCALGAGRKGKIRAEGTKNIIDAMEKSDVRRLICESSLGVGDSRPMLNFFWKHIMFGLLLREAYADHELQEKYVKQSKLKWTIVRPAAFTGGDLTKNYHHFEANAKNLKLKISRADVADFMLKQLTDETYLYKTPGLSY